MAAAGDKNAESSELGRRDLSEFCVLTDGRLDASHGGLLGAVSPAAAVAKYRLPRTTVAATVACFVALFAGCAAQAGAQTHAASPTAATNGQVAVASRRVLAAQYLVIARAGNRRLESDFDPLKGRDRNRLAAAKADLRNAASTERLFDRRLLRIKFPPNIERVARELYRINQARAKLTAAAAASTSLRRLHAYERQLDAANVPVERAVDTIRRQLGLPPADTS